MRSLLLWLGNIGIAYRLVHLFFIELGQSFRSDAGSAYSIIVDCDGQSWFVLELRSGAGSEYACSCGELQKRNKARWSPISGW